MNLDGEALTFGIEDDKFKLLEYGEPTAYIFKLEENSIRSSGGDLEQRNHPKNVNDPMIVLDGRAFVTAYNKPPWR
ncbi:MAG TPA: hypothetical protein VFG10_06315 [Saprospiraceae bacterium]|nr:hypothetical protein [Saprospiraceae bacterium]